MCLIIRKCDSDGVPQACVDPDGHWDVFDDTQKRSVSKHNRYIEAKLTADTLGQFPILRPAFEESISRGASHSSILSALFSAYVEGVKSTHQ